MESSSSSSSEIRMIPLQTEAFVEALHGYIDQEKPDPLQKRQMEGWKMVWRQQEPQTASTATTTITEEVGFEPTHAVAGTLEWTGDHVVLTLTSRCYWCSGNNGEDDDDATKEEDGSLFFQCLASARFVEVSNNDTSKTEAKIRTQMRERLQQDDYIAKLLPQRSSKNGKEASSLAPLRQQAVELCQASVSSNGSNHLEERVYCNEAAAEAVRRALYSTSNNGPIDVFELVCSLPLLPTTSANTTLSSSIGNSTTTKLANRAKLRLLEDAMYDACENEGEEELVQALRLSGARSSTAGDVAVEGMNTTTNSSTVSRTLSNNKNRGKESVSQQQAQPSNKKKKRR